MTPERHAANISILYARLSSALANPAFAGWSLVDASALTDGHVMHLSPPRELTNCAEAEALQITKLIAGEWTRRDSSWWCKCDGPLTGVSIILLNVEAEIYPRPPFWERAAPLDLVQVEASLMLATEQAEATA